VIDPARESWEFAVGEGGEMVVIRVEKDGAPFAMVQLPGDVVRAELATMPAVGRLELRTLAACIGVLAGVVSAVTEQVRLGALAVDEARPDVDAWSN
jgi:hypothetical protein